MLPLEGLYKPILRAQEDAAAYILAGAEGAMEQKFAAVVYIPHACVRYLKAT